MTTFKNNAKYAEVLLTYLDVARREDNPLKIPDVLRTFRWRFKGGSLTEASESTRLNPLVSEDVYPDGMTQDLAKAWPGGRDCAALRELLNNRASQRRLRRRAILARIGTYQMLTAPYGGMVGPVEIYTGMKAIYHMFGVLWDWSATSNVRQDWKDLEGYTQELLVGSAAVSRAHVPTADEARRQYWQSLEESRVPALFMAIFQIKEIIRMAGSAKARSVARQMGLNSEEMWVDNLELYGKDAVDMEVARDEVLYLPTPLGPMLVKVGQEVAMYGNGQVRFALGKSDMERLHQLVMSATSALVGVSAQAAVGTATQKQKARLAVMVADKNIQRIVESARMVALGDEVLVCKGYRKASTALLGHMAGSLCVNEYLQLKLEAMATAGPGVLDVEGFLYDAMTLDAASALNAAKMFKICPAPDVCPAYAMMDRVKQIGDGNRADGAMISMFEEELRSQILRAYIRSSGKRLRLRSEKDRPLWFSAYQQGRFDEVPSSEIHRYLAWEATAEMPDISPYDPAHWKDSGLGADTIWEANNRTNLGVRANMMTRLVFDDECPMPGRELLNSDHVIEFFVKAEGHKDPARGIFSANLVDRQAQSWMEKAVDRVAKSHPSYMIGQEVDVREAKVAQLTAIPGDPRWVALYYSFDISGWSAKMPAEPQMVSHKLWGDLYGGHLFRRAHEINTGAHIYLNLDGYKGWYKNTHSNLEGFNGKEMTMVLIAMLSLSVRRWRTRVVSEGILPSVVADSTVALLFAYIDDGLSRIDLPRTHAMAAFQIYKETVIETFANCGFTMEVSKCFPSDRFSIFLNEVYLAGRHVVHGVRAAMAIGSKPTERHTSLVERVGSVSTGVRGAVMAGLNPLSGTLLMAYHVFLHLVEWINERDPVITAAWSLAPMAWGGLGLPNMLQLYVSGSGSAFEEGVATLQCYARMNPAVKKYFLRLAKTELTDRGALSVITAPLGGRVDQGYMVDSRVATAVRIALQTHMEEGMLSRYATRLLKYSDMRHFSEYAEAIMPVGMKEVLQEQMIDNAAEAHPHSIFSSFAWRLEKSTTVMTIVGRDLFSDMIEKNREEAKESIRVARSRTLY